MRTTKNGMSKANELLPCFVKARPSLHRGGNWKTLVSGLRGRVFRFPKNNWGDCEKWIGAVAAVADGCDGRSRPGVRNIPARPVPDARPSALGHHLLHHARRSRWANWRNCTLKLNGANVFCFLSSLTPSPQAPAHHGSVWLISLLLTNTVSRVRAFLSIWLERFRRTQKED